MNVCYNVCTAKRYKLSRVPIFAPHTARTVRTVVAISCHFQKLRSRLGTFFAAILYIYIRKSQTGCPMSFSWYFGSLVYMLTLIRYALTFGMRLLSSYRSHMSFVGTRFEKNKHVKTTKTVDLLDAMLGLGPQDG